MPEYVDSDAHNRELLQNPEVKAAYEALEPEFQLVEAMLRKRQQKGMTQAALAKKIGTTQSVIARLEGGKGNPSYQFLQRVARGLDAKLSISFE